MKWFQSLMVLFSRLTFKLMGWEAKQPYPMPKKFLIIVAPHTSNWDFMIGLLARYALGYGLSTKFLGKSPLFKSPHGFLFRWLGGIPVERSSKQNMVEQMVSVYSRYEEIGMAVAPEGTRKYVKDWKTGFYYIAWKAGVPIVPIGFDYGSKRVIVFDLFYPCGNIEEDLPKLKALFTEVKAYTPSNYNYTIEKRETGLEPAT